jgi:arylsulfatase A-like enzyme
MNLLPSFPIGSVRRSSLRIGLFGLLSLCILVFTGCDGGAATPDQPPNVLWITAEDIGPALGAYGDDYARTPNLDRLAEESILYRNAYASAPICAPARSSLITGMRAVSLGTQHLRSKIPIPDSIDALPEYLRDEGYFTTNNAKTDYNFSAEGRWDENSGEAHWRHRSGDQPFFSVFNYGITHEGQVNSPPEDTVTGISEYHDPAKASIPPYHPDTPEMRQLWARQYDLITKLDQTVGTLLQQLKADGAYENTIIFFVSDHGYGLPRYKRWLYDSGLRVPLLVRVPDKYDHLAEPSPGDETDRLVSFEDLAPTVLSLTGVDIPAHMQGHPFLGPDAEPSREYVYGTRSRADDAYDMSRTITDGRYRYTRNFMPHRPYIQEAIIFSDERKPSYRELRRVYQNGNLPDEGRDMFTRKPPAELYDTKSDPYETNNLIDSPKHQEIRKELRSNLFEWILKVRDTGFLHEAEYMLRAEGSTPYEMAQNPDQYNLSRILEAARQVGRDDVSLSTLTQQLQSPDSGVRFWAVTALLARGADAAPATDALTAALNDSSPSVRLASAEALCKLDRCQQALPVLAEGLDHERPWVVLQAAIHTRHIGAKAEPIVPDIKNALSRYRGDVWGRYKTWDYPMFIGFALDQALINTGAQDPKDLVVLQ